MVLVGLRGCRTRTVGKMEVLCGFVGTGPVFGRQLKGLRSVRTAPRRSRNVVVAVEQNTIIAVGTALLGTLGGVGLLVWTEEQGKRNEVRENNQECFECKGAKQIACSICGGTGLDPVFKSDEEKCAYCDGTGTVDCSNCNATGIQPRFLDRFSPDDFMD